MRYFHSIEVLLISIIVISISGCSGKEYSLAPVSGTVTHEGKPVAKLGIYFSPEPVGENYAVGPYSKGVTDSDGKFTIKTRYDEKGGVVGKHTLTFEYTDISETAMSELQEALNDAKDSGSGEEVKETNEKIRKLTAKLKGRPVLDGRKMTIDIPADGLQDFKIELSDLSQQ